MALAMGPENWAGVAARAWFSVVVMAFMLLLLWLAR